MKKKTKICQNIRMPSKRKRSSGLVECSFVNLVERLLEKTSNLCSMSEKDGES